MVDSGSTDDTCSIAKEWEPSVHAHADWPGFGPQKNRALGYAGKDWVFSIDADERVTPELRAEIEQAMQSGKADGYYCPRLSQFCGQFVHHSGWYPDYVLRLFKQGAGKFSVLWVETCEVSEDEKGTDLSVPEREAFGHCEKQLHHPLQGPAQRLETKPYFVSLQNVLCGRVAPAYHPDGVHLREFGPGGRCPERHPRSQGQGLGGLRRRIGRPSATPALRSSGGPRRDGPAIRPQASDTHASPPL